METVGKILLGSAVVLALSGAVLLLGARAGLERLPGDIILRKGNFTFYAPIGLMIIASVVLTIVLNFIGRR